jgi:hypothetical protein
MVYEKKLGSSVALDFDERGLSDYWKEQSL